MRTLAVSAIAGVLAYVIAVFVSPDGVHVPPHVAFTIIVGVGVAVPVVFHIAVTCGEKVS